MKKTGRERIKDKAQLRFGTRVMRLDGSSFTVRDHLDGIGLEIIKDGPPRGYARWKDTGVISPFLWHLTERLPKPEDFVLAKSKTTLEDIYRTGEWEGMHPAMPAPIVMEGSHISPHSNLDVIEMPKNMPVSLDPNAPEEVKQGVRAANRKQRKALEAKARKDAKAAKRRGH